MEEQVSEALKHTKDGTATGLNVLGHSGSSF